MGSCGGVAVCAIAWDESYWATGSRCGKRGPRVQTSNRAIRLDGPKCMSARAGKGLSRERLAEESRGGLSIATIKRLEKGVAVYLDTARRLAALLEVPLGELVSPSEVVSVEGDLATPAVVVVLPFEAMGSDSESRCFADGLVEDLITRFGKRWFPVISRVSSFSCGDAQSDPRKLKTELGADYAIEGSVRRHGGQLRLTARLTDTKTACQLWANSYDRAYADVFALQDALVTTLVGQIGGAIIDKEYNSQRQREPTDLSAWELALRGSWYFHRRSKDGNSEARSLFEQALRRDPMLPIAWYSLAMAHQRAIFNQWSPDPGRTLQEMKEVCAEFGRLYPNDSGLHVASAYAAVYSGERRSAMARLREAIDLDPNASTAYSLYGQTLAMENDADDAIEQFELAMRLSPRDSELWSIHIGVALCHFVAERYEDMLQSAQLAVITRPDMPFPYGTVAVARAYLGDVDEARAAVKIMRELEPQTSLQGVQAVSASVHPDILARYLEGLRRAGVGG
jgi:adenylate cyclase